jgi:peptidyl-prolyl cis-trans isomerase B (cyclophilin B)
MSRPRMLALAISVSMAAAAFGAAPIVAQDDPQPPSATPNPVPHEAPAGDGTAVRLTTDVGDVVIGLYNESAPVAAENFLNLAESGYYDGVGFHRVVPGFVVQGGDPEGTGRGGPGYGIEDETVVGDYGRGTVAMARTQAPNSQGSQFFFVLDDTAQPALESARTYVIFGTVIEGMDVVDAIVEAREPSDLIEDPVRIISATVEQAELPEPEASEPPSEAQLAADALAAKIPSEVAGLSLEGTTFTAEQILTGSEEDVAMVQLGSIAEQNGGQLSSLAIATAGDDNGEAFATILASSIAGVPAEAVKEPLIQLILGDQSGAMITEETVAGHNVTLIRPTEDAGDTDSIRVIANGDIVWFIVADADSIEEVVSSLPLLES